MFVVWLNISLVCVCCIDLWVLYWVVIVVVWCGFVCIWVWVRLSGFCVLGVLR